MWPLFFSLLASLALIGTLWIKHLQSQITLLRNLLGMSKDDELRSTVMTQLMKAVELGYGDAFKQAQTQFTKEIDDMKRIVNQHEFQLASVKAGGAAAALPPLTF